MRVEDPKVPCDDSKVNSGELIEEFEDSSGRSSSECMKFKPLKKTSENRFCRYGRRNKHQKTTCIKVIVASPLSIIKNI